MSFARNVAAGCAAAVVFAIAAGTADLASAQQPARPLVRQVTPRVVRPSQPVRRQPVRRPVRQQERPAGRPTEVTGGFG